MSDQVKSNGEAKPTGQDMAWAGGIIEAELANSLNRSQIESDLQKALRIAAEAVKLPTRKEIESYLILRWNEERHLFYVRGYCADCKKGFLIQAGEQYAVCPWCGCQFRDKIKEGVETARRVLTPAEMDRLIAAKEHEITRMGEALDKKPAARLVP